MVRFLHTADWQLGKVFARVEDPAKRTLLQDERIRAIDRIGEAARAHEAAFIVVAGDLFESSTVPRATVSKALAAIGRLQRPVYVIPGNHDHGGTGGLWTQDYFRREHAELAPNLRVLATTEPLVRDDAVLLPCPLLRRHETTDPTAWLRTLDDAWAQFGDRPRIVLAHGAVHGFTSDTGGDEDDPVGGAPNRIAVERLPAGEIDFVALGDWHGTKEITPHAWYAGAPEQDRFGKGDDYRAGQVLAVTARRGAVPEVAAVTTGRIGWHTLAHAFTDDASVDALAERIHALVGHRVDEDLLALELEGALSFAARDALERHRETWESRLLRLKLADRTRYAPTDEEVEALTRRGDDPLISQVATALLEQTAAGAGEDAEIARRALRELHRLAG